MDASFIQPLLDWVAQHPTWSGLIILTVSIAESLAIVGLFVPGATIMFGVGALVATGSLDLWSSIGWAVTGAVVGDGISFWIGHYYKKELRTVWPFRRYTRLMERGEAFVEKHGGKSILFGRFVGPVRPIVPAVAGMLGMKPLFFFMVNVLSALAWGPAYILPGVAFGASLGIASEVAARLAVLLLILVAVLWLVQWLVRKVYLFVQPRANDIIERALTWSESRRFAGPLTAAVVDPDYPELRGLLILGSALLIVSLALFATMQAISNEAVTQFNVTVFHFFESLRTPLADQIMIAITQLGSAYINIPIFIGVFAWLAWQRRWQAVAHWAGAVAFGALMTWAIKAILHVPRPPTGYAEAADFAFPSGHVTMSVVIYGFLAVMIAREHRGPARWLPYAAAGSWIATMALSRLYLGAHWLTDVLGGLLLGITWVALLGIAYRRHRPPSLSTARLTLIVSGLFLLVGAWHIDRHHAREVERYLPLYETQSMNLNDWWQNDWRTLPAYRIDLRDRRDHPLTVQYDGTLDALRTQLEPQGWHKPLSLSFVTMLHWLSPKATIDQLPVLPQVHDGWNEKLVLVHDSDQPDRKLVLRLWPAYVELRNNSGKPTPLWLGNVSYYELDSAIPFITIARTGDDFNTPLQVFAKDVTALTTRTVNREPETNNSVTRFRHEWNGDVVLVR